MKRLFSFALPLALGLFIGNYQADWLEPATAALAGRGLASIESSSTETPKATADPEAALALFSHMSAEKIRSVCETARELYATKAVSSYARYIRDFSNYSEHDEYLRKRTRTLLDNGPAWRGETHLQVNESTIDLEVVVAPLKSDQECFAVQIYASRDGGLRQTETGTHCISDLTFKDGNYFLSWAGASGSLYHLDISAVLISLPNSKANLVSYLIDGQDEWKNSNTFSWTPISPEDQTLRLAQLLDELNL